MRHSIVSASRWVAAGLAACLVAASAQIAAAEVVRVQASHNYRDPATGYLCLTPSCDTVRLPKSDCICVKGNAITQDPYKVKLDCKQKKQGKWVACQVKSKY